MLPKNHYIESKDAEYFNENRTSFSSGLGQISKFSKVSLSIASIPIPIIKPWYFCNLLKDGSIYYSLLVDLVTEFKLH